MKNKLSLPNETRAQIFYFNDIHATVSGAKKIKTASDRFDINTKHCSDKIDIMKFSAGDTYIGRTQKNFAGVFLNSLNLDAYVPGNHEFDMGTKAFSSYINNNLFKTLISNIRYDKNSNFNDDLESKRLCKSTIIEKNGHKYGLIGATDVDLPMNVSAQSYRLCKDIKVMNLDDTIKAVQNEINSLKSQGINKIILLSHLGIAKDKRVAQETDGLDIIVGGHSHTVLKGVVPNENYFMSKSNEPVLIVQAGMNGENYGILDVLFDENGKLKAADNKVTSTKNTDNSLLVEVMDNKIYGPPKKLATIVGSAKKPFSFEITESPVATLVADAIREKSGADIGFHNIFCQKIDVNEGDITDRELLTVLPYVNEVTLYRYSEKDVVDVIKAGLLSDDNGIKGKVGNPQVSGLNYVVSKDRQLKELYFIDKSGHKTKIDINNPRTDKFYTVAYGAYFSGGPGKLKLMRAPEKEIKVMDWDDFTAVKEKLLSYGNKPFVLKKEGRIKVV